MLFECKNEQKFNNKKQTLIEMWGQYKSVIKAFWGGGNIGIILLNFFFFFYTKILNKMINDNCIYIYIYLNG